jgi:hypothetical protein
MKRRLRHYAAGLSAALWVATLVAWPWSYFEAVDFSTLRFSALLATDVGVVVCEGRAMVYFAHARGPTPTFMGVFHNGELPFNLDLYRSWSPGTPAPEANWNVGPFAYWRSVEMGTRYRRMFAPVWFPLLALSVLPALWLRRHRRERQARRRLTQSACPGCGYDLCGDAGRSDLRSARCPECGRNPLEAYDAAL